MMTQNMRLATAAQAQDGRISAASINDAWVDAVVATIATFRDTTSSRRSQG